MLPTTSFMFTLQSVPLLLSSLALAANPPIDDALYTAFVRYTKFSAASYADDCPTPPFGAAVAKFFDNSDTNTQGYLFRDDAAQELVLAFRGTSNAIDLFVDFDQGLVPYDAVGVTGCSDCTVHGGYLEAWNSVSSDVIDTIDSELATNPDYSLVVTGHSLGGGLASLASGSLASASLGLNFTTYTFGQPRTGNPAYANFIDQILPEGKMFRVTHGNDGVPQTITIADGFHHHSTEYWENDPDSAATTVKCSGQEPADCNNSVRGTGAGANLIGINAAHLEYSGMSIGNPFDGGASACDGS